MHKNMPATTWQAWVHVFNYFTCLLDRGGSKQALFSLFYIPNCQKWDYTLFIRKKKGGISPPR